MNIEKNWILVHPCTCYCIVFFPLNVSNQGTLFLPQNKGVKWVNTLIGGRAQNKGRSAKSFRYYQAWYPTQLRSSPRSFLITSGTLATRNVQWRPCYSNKLLQCYISVDVTVVFCFVILKARSKRYNAPAAAVLTSSQKNFCACFLSYLV